MKENANKNANSLNLKHYSPIILTTVNNIKRCLNEQFKEYRSLICEDDYDDGFSPLSGSEPDFNPNVWNDVDSIRDNHNCYAYAINKIAKRRLDKPQPGYASGHNHISINEYDCITFFDRIKKDVPSLYLIGFKQPCQAGYHKAFFTIAPGDDYHFYRQDKSGYWSHKPGRTDVIDVDSDGNKIKNPLLAARRSMSFEYSVPCFYFCVKSSLASLHSSSLS